MNIEPLHTHFEMPTRSTEFAAGYDLYMPEAGVLEEDNEEGKFIPLGFAAEVPVGYMAMLLPRSGKGCKDGLALNNTVGIIDADYRGEWMACIRRHELGGDMDDYVWEAGDKLLQFILVPVHTPELVEVDDLSDTARGVGGFGSTDRGASV